MTTTPGEHGIDVVHVVVPARDEVEHLDPLVVALERAVARLRRERPGIRVRTTVVLDLCADGSADVLAGRPGIDVLEVSVGVVGAVRAAGVTHARERTPRVGAARVWVACTDADSTVPEEWLTWQVALAEDGHDLVAGAVHPDPRDLSPTALRAWWERHRLGEGHPHVHGANLGFRLSAYDAVGGFAPLRTGEDADLVARFRAAGLACYATARHPVTTSGRHVGRAPAGFAAFLAALGP